MELRVLQSTGLSCREVWPGFPNFMAKECSRYSRAQFEHTRFCTVSDTHPSSRASPNRKPTALKPAGTSTLDAHKSHAFTKVGLTTNGFPAHAGAASPAVQRRCTPREV
eukprot:1139886-Pelagomonas_calceolata.AAC.6